MADDDGTAQKNKDYAYWNLLLLKIDITPLEDIPNVKTTEIVVRPVVKQIEQPAKGENRW